MVLPVKLYMAGGKRKWVVMDKLLICEVHLCIAAVPVYLSESVNKVRITAVSPGGTCWTRMEIRSPTVRSSLPSLVDYIRVNTADSTVQTLSLSDEPFVQVLSSPPVNKKGGGLFRLVTWIHEAEDQINHGLQHEKEVDMCEQVTRSWQSPDHDIDVFQGGSARGICKTQSIRTPVNSLTPLDPICPRIRALGVLFLRGSAIMSQCGPIEGNIHRPIRHDLPLAADQPKQAKRRRPDIRYEIFRIDSLSGSPSSGNTGNPFRHHQ